MCVCERERVCARIRIFCSYMYVVLGPPVTKVETSEKVCRYVGPVRAGPGVRV